MKKKLENILITGGCGFIGSNFINKILYKDYNIVIIDNLSSGFIENLIYLKKKFKNKKKIHFFKINLENYQKTKEIFHKFEFKYIFHFAAYSSVEMSLKNPKKIYSNNINSTKNLINLAIICKVKYFVFSSSAAVYGNSKFEKYIMENSKTNPINPYGKSKLICENLIKRKFKNYKIKYAIFRYFNVVGRQLSNKVKKKKNLNLFETINETISNKKIFKIHGKKISTKDNTPVRDYIHVYDIVNAHIECLKVKNKSFWSNTYNIGYNKGTSVLDILNECKKIFGNKLRFKYISKKTGIIQKSVACNFKFRKKTKWSPKFDKVEKLIRSYYIK